MTTSRFFADRWTALTGVDPSAGWVAYLPVPAVGSSHAELSSELQPGGRLYYIDPVDGSEADAPVFYLHTGTAIIDTAGNTAHPVSGLPYGTDPFNPGPGVRANKFYSALGPTRGGHPIGIRTGGNYGVGNKGPGGTLFDRPAPGRNARPDWWLGKRGRTLDLAADLAGYKAAATGWLADGMNLTLPGADSASGGVQLWGSYGPPAEPPFKVLDPLGYGIAYLSQAVDWDNVVYQDLWIDGHNRGLPYRPVAEGGTANAGSQSFMAAGGITGGAVRLQGLLLDGAPQIGITGESACTFDIFDCRIIDSHGLVQANISAVDAHGAKASNMLMRGCMLVQGGWRFNPRRVRDDWATFPAYVPGQAGAWGDIVTITNGANVTAYHCDVAAPAGSAINTVNPATGGTYWARCGLNGEPLSDTVRDRNAYCASPSQFIESASICGGSGFQFRHGSRIDRSFMFEGYVQLGHLWLSGGGYPDGAVPAASVKDTTILNYSPGTSGQPGWGLNLGGGLADAVIDGLLVSGAHHPLQTAARIETVGLETSSFWYGLPVRRNIITNSVLDCGAGPALNVTDGAAISAHGINNAYSVYSPTANNNANSVVRVGGYPVTAAYKCIQAVPKDSGIPLTNTAYWQPTTPDETNVAGYTTASAPGTIGCGIASTTAIISTRQRGNLLNYVQQWGAPATTDATIAADAPLYANRAAYAAATGATGTERTLKTYLTDVLGWPITSASGVKELCDRITGRVTGQPLHRGNWPAALNPLAINNYLRDGWALPLLTAADPGGAGISISGAIDSALLGMGGTAAGAVDIAAAMGIALADMGGGLTGSVGELVQANFLRGNRRVARIVKREVAR